MSESDKELLLKDLCARLPYGVIIQEYNEEYGYSDNALNTISIGYFSIHEASIEGTWINHIENVKPYLRSLSSMTEEKAKELLFVRLSSKYGKSCAYIKNFIKLNEVSFRKESPYEGSIVAWFSFKNKIHDTPQIREYSKCEYLGQINDITLAEIDWLNAHHFDYRGLIEKGLAIEVTKENNPYGNL